MRKSPLLLALLLVCLAFGTWAKNAVDVPDAVSFAGTVVDQSSKPVRGAIVTVFDRDEERSISVFSREDGSFRIDELPADRDYDLRARLIGLEDTMVEPEAPFDSIELVMAPARDLNMQRPANDLLDLLEFDNEADALNFKMMCAYCHQLGTLGFRSPEEPVDWEVMITRMDGFKGLYAHTQENLVDRLVMTYGRDAEKDWPTYTPPPAPSGAALDVEITEWQMGLEDYSFIHDLEVGLDGSVYAVDSSNDAVLRLDLDTGERATYSIPGGKVFGDTSSPIKGPHSIEMAANGDMWLTLCLSGEMAKFDPKTKEYTVVSGHPTRKRSGYPHTLRIDHETGIVWWTDAGLGVFSLDPETYEVKFYDLPDANQVRGGGAGGESRGVTPYGLDIAPDHKVWYSKLHGQRVGRVDPEAADGSPEQIVEWKPPVHGPRRLHVAPDGIVWVPGWASGNIASFEPVLEEWTVYDLPHGANSFPYALNIHPKTGDIWITGTGTDSMLRFDPETEDFTEYRMPTRVTYTREIEFDAEGNVWTCNSNGPTRHIENHHGSVIRLVLN